LSPNVTQTSSSYHNTHLYNPLQVTLTARIRYESPS